MMKFFSGYSAKIKTLLLMGGVFGFSVSTVLYMVAPYLKEVLQSDNVSLVYTITTITTLLLFSFFLKMVYRVGKNVAFFSIVLLQIILLALLVQLEGSGLSLVVLVAYLVGVPFVVITIDMLLESYTAENISGRVRGLYIFFVSIGFLLAPFISGFCVDAFGFASIFFLSLIGYSIVFLLGFTYYLRIKKEKKSLEKVSLWSVAHRLYARGDAARVYGIAILLEAFYTVTIIAVPLYLINLGITLSQLGLIFTVMLLPFLLLPHISGYLADTHWGEKEMLIGSMVWIGLILLVMSETTTGSMLVWMVLLFASRIGASLMETMRDSYYFKKVNGSDLELIAFFRTARPLGTLLASIVLFIFLNLHLSFGLVFMFTGICFFASIFLVLPIKDSEPGK